MSNKERIDFYFRCQVGADSKNGVLLDYWQSEDTEMPLREMILGCGLAYWLPFAYKRLDCLEADELKQVVRSSIYQLMLHIAYLRNSFGFFDENLIGENSDFNLTTGLESRAMSLASAQMHNGSSTTDTHSATEARLDYIDDGSYDEADELIRKISNSSS